MKRNRKQKKRKKGPLLIIVVLLILFVSMSGKLSWIVQKPIEKEKIETAIGIPYVVDNIPKSEKRPHFKRSIKYIVVHNTANPNSTAKNERDYLVNTANLSSTSWHLAVDDKEVVEAVPLTEMAFHAGKLEGNRYGIGIEICESGNYKKTEKNAEKLIAYLMAYYHIPIENIKTHQDFTGKDCPRIVLEHWDDFIKGIETEYDKLK